MSDASNDNRESTLIADRLQAVRDRIARRMARPMLHPPELEVPSLNALRRSGAEAAHLADSIGSVNPRPPGIFNEFIQAGKRFVARALDWIVRPQRDFNHAVLENIAGNAARTAEALEATNRNLLALAEAVKQAGEIHWALGEEMDAALEGIRNRYDALLSELKEQMKLQKWALDGVIVRQSDRVNEIFNNLQDQLWKGLESLRDETRTLRQRVAAQARAQSALSSAPPPAASPATAAPQGIDYFQIERHFRGTEEGIRERQEFYLPFFQGRQNVLDIACGRGEFLELMRQTGVRARGVDLDADMVGRCLEKGLSVTQADVFQFLETVPDGSLDGIFCSQFVEHLRPESYIRLLMQCGEKLAGGGVLAIETQNPECLAIFSQSFYLDPTHMKPVPPALLRVLFAEAGLDRITTHYLAPAAAAVPLIPELPAQALEVNALQAWNTAVRRFNETFFGGMDYAVIGYRAASGPVAEK